SMINNPCHIEALGKAQLEMDWSLILNLMVSFILIRKIFSQQPQAPTMKCWCLILMGLLHLIMSLLEVYLELYHWKMAVQPRTTDQSWASLRDLQPRLDQLRLEL